LRMLWFRDLRRLFVGRFRLGIRRSWLGDLRRRLGRCWLLLRLLLALRLLLGGRRAATAVGTRPVSDDDLHRDRRELDAGEGRRGAREYRQECSMDCE